jgi:hypothetical protein
MSQVCSTATLDSMGKRARTRTLPRPARLALLLTVLIASTPAAVCSLTDPIPPRAGAAECPCLTNSSDPVFRAINEELRAKGYAAFYGLSGCQKHDLDNALEGCDHTVSNPPQYCNSPWCFVDVDKCAIDKDRCTSGGGILGSDLSPFCRDREHLPSALVTSTPLAYFSYSTCGSLNTYGALQVKELSGEQHLKFAVPPDPYPPWTFTAEVDPAFPHWKGHTGPQAPTFCELWL